jgi:hypothetical protein
MVNTAPDMTGARLSSRAHQAPGSHLAVAT